MMKPEYDFSTIDFKDRRLEKRLQTVIENSRKNAGGIDIGFARREELSKSVLPVIKQ